MLLINGKTPKKIIYKGLAASKVIYNGICVWMAKALAWVTGAPPLRLDFSTGEDLVDYKVYGESMQDGTPTPDAPVEILSVGEPTINLYCGKSEFTYSTTTNTTNSSFYETFKVGKTYTLYCYIDNTQGTGIANIRMSVGKTGGSYDYNTSNDIAAGKEGYAKTTFTIPSNYNSVLNMQYKTIGGITTFKDIMLVEGSYTLSKLPEYIKPYRIPIKVNDKTYDIYATEPLRKIGDCADYIDFTNGKIVRNIKKSRLTGSEGWAVSGKRFYFSSSNLNIKCLGTGVVGIKSNTLPGKPWDWIRNSGIGIATYVDNRIDIRADELWETVNDAKTYLQFNPTTYIAPCLTPVEEEVDLPQISTNNGTNIITVDTIVAPSNMEINYYKQGG
jgi:hypothetical protein